MLALGSSARIGQPRPCPDRALIMPGTCRSRPYLADGLDGLPILLTPLGLTRE